LYISVCTFALQRSDFVNYWVNVLFGVRLCVSVEVEESRCSS